MFTWLVSPVVTMSAVANQTNNVGDPVTVQVSANDAKNAALTFPSATNLPPGLSISTALGQPITGTVAGGSAGQSLFLDGEGFGRHQQRQPSFHLDDQLGNGRARRCR